MKSPFLHISRSLALKIGLGILIFVAAVFTFALGYLYKHSRDLVKEEAMDRAEQMLNNTELLLMGYLLEVETVTDNAESHIFENLHPDSLLKYSRRTVELSKNFNGCSITMEPGFFPQLDHNFSAYTVRSGDLLETEVEADYNYYAKPWYKAPHDKGEACWIDPYNDYTEEGTLRSPVMITSYCRPIHNAEGKIIGVISTDLSIEWLSRAISAHKPYPNSYCFMLGSDGHYFVHPDHMKLVKESIFKPSDGKKNPEMIALGHEMITGQSGTMTIDLNGETCLVFYRPVSGTPWSIALVCPESDIFAGYNRLSYMLGTLIVIGLLLMFFVCWRLTKHFLQPLHVLAQQARQITDGNYEQELSHSNRTDVVGQLQNSFVSMQNSIHEHITRIQAVNDDLEKSNEKLAEEANQRKTIFIHDMSMQIRTPLNLIAGFMQVLRDTYGLLSTEEKDNFTDTMKQNAVTVQRMAHMLFDVSWRGDNKTYDTSKAVYVNEAVEKSIQDFKEKAPHDVRLDYSNALSDSKCIFSNALYLHRILRELLFNAKKFAPKSIVGLHVDIHGDKIRFVIEDNGPGIPREEREHVFEPFVKLDCFTEGLGIGLGLTRQHVTNLGGTIIIDPDYTDGTRIIVEIPDR